MANLRAKHFMLMICWMVVACAKTNQSPTRQIEKNTKEENLNRDGSRSNEEEKESLKERVAPFIPYEVPAPIKKQKTESARAFEIFEPYLNVDLNSETMTFTGKLCISSTTNNCSNLKTSQTEALRMACQFDRTVLPLECSDMFPTDKTKAEQKRLQASVLCMKMEVTEDGRSICTELVFDFFVVIEGKKQSQRFESSPVYVRHADSGDPSDFDLDELDQPPPVKKDPIKKTEEPKTVQKPTRAKPPKKDQARLEFDNEIIFAEPVLELAEIEEEMENETSDEALEYDGPTVTPSPKGDHQYSIPGIDKIKPTLGANSRRQAYRRHNDGQLFNANMLKRNAKAPYLLRTSDDVNGVPQRAYGTDLMIDLLEKSIARLNEKFPGRPEVVIASISKKEGGRLCRSQKNGKLKCHRSHQTGLDADIAYPSKTNSYKDLWNSAKNSQFDSERFLFLAKTMVGAEGSPVIVLFVDRAIKRETCLQAKKQFPAELKDPQSLTYKALRHMVHLGGHVDHFHLRLDCPPGSSGCKPVYVAPKFKGTGCN